MERTIFLQHYRVGLKSDGTPREISRDGGAITYEAFDERTRERVDLKLIPLESIEPSLREQLDDKARAAQNMRHVNIAKVFDFGREGGDLVCISEHLPGETLAAWVSNHGPMPADASLRVAEQIVSVLSSASFHRLPYPPIEPSDIIVVPGQTPEGTWPLVKLINFGLPAVAADSKLESATLETSEEVSSAQQSVTPEKLTRGMMDIRSEIYSLGATLYFLLTGVALSAEASKGTPKLSRFPKPLRVLLGRMLHRHPDQRPKDLIVLAEMIRQCLQKIERRRARAEKYGIPYRATFPPRKRAPLGPLVRIVLPLAAVLIAAGVLAALLLPEPISRFIHPNRETKEIGVLVGVPESSRKSAVQDASIPNPPAAATSQGTTAAVPASSQSPVNAAVASNASEVPPPDVQQTQTTTSQSQVIAPKTSKASSPTGIVQNSSPAGETNTAQKPDVGSQAAASASQSSLQSPSSPAGEASAPTGETNASQKSDVGTQAATANESSSQSKKKSVASASRRAHRDQSMADDFTQRGSRSVRARVVGITSDGRFILRLPSGRTAIIAPDGGRDESAPRRHRRPYIGRDEMFAPPPQFQRDFDPND